MASGEFLDIKQILILKGCHACRSILRVWTRNQKNFKQFVAKNDGWVKPDELVAIMGSSGSGKTS